jgi:hypothetical protein
VYLDLDYGGALALDAVQNSDLVPRPNYVLNTSPDKFQIVWKVEGMTIDEAEALNQALVREFDGDPAATDSTRVLRLPGFANKKYESDFYVKAHAESAQKYHLRDFKLGIDSQHAPRHYELKHKQSSSGGNLSQSEHDWAYAKRRFDGVLPAFWTGRAHSYCHRSGNTPCSRFCFCGDAQ